MTTFSLIQSNDPLPIDFPEVWVRKETADKSYLKVSGDKMLGNLSLNGNRITDLGNPNNLTDAVSVQHLNSMLIKIKGEFKENIGQRLEVLERKASDNSKHIQNKYNLATKEITDLKHFLLNKLPKFHRIEGVIDNEKNINNLVFTFSKDESLSKNIALIQVLIETTEGVWFNLQLLFPSYKFRIYEKAHKLFITSEGYLPPNWTRKINFVYVKT